MTESGSSKNSLAPAPASRDRAARAVMACVPVLGFFAFVWSALADAALVVLVTGAIWMLARKEADWRSPPFLLALAWMLYVLVSALAATWFEVPGHHLRGLEKHIPLALGPICAVSLSAASAQLRVRRDVLVAWFLAGLVAGAAVLLIRNGVLGLFLHGWPQPTVSLGAINRNYAAFACGVSLVASAGLVRFIYEREIFGRLWTVIGIAVIALYEAAVLVALQSRTGYLAAAVSLAVCIVVLLVMGHRKRTLAGQKTSWLLPLIAIAGMIVVGIFSYPLVSPRLNGAGASAYAGLVRDLVSGHASDNALIVNGTEDRLKLIAVGIDLFKQRPITGWGPDVGYLIAISPFPGIRNLTQFHNGYLQTLVSFGLAGAGLLVALLGAIVVAGLNNPYDAQGSRISPPLLASLLGVIVYVAITNFTESILFVKAAAVICLFGAALACMRPPEESGRT